MTTPEADGSSRHPVFEAIAPRPRRVLLRLLFVKDEPLSEQDVLAHLAEVDQETHRERSTGEDRTRHSALFHTHLPALADADLIAWDREEKAVERTSHAAYDDPRFRLLLEAEADDLDLALSTLAIDRRRALLTVLRDAPESMTRTDLARELLRSDATDFDPDKNAVDDVVLLLHHIYLPALVESNFVEYDPAADRVAYADNPALEEVFTIIFEPDERLADSYDDFFQGVKAGFDRLRRGTKTQAEWPDDWRDPNHA